MLKYNVLDKGVCRADRQITSEIAADYLSLYCVLMNRTHIWSGHCVISIIIELLILKFLTNLIELTSVVS